MKGKDMTATLMNGRFKTSSSTTVREFVTPDMAFEWLARNDHNRSLRWADVEYLRDCILLKSWRTTHQGIAFYEDGSLADGQHRLHAIVEAGVGVWVNVTKGMSKENADAIDRGIPRNNRDHLHFKGVKADTRMVAACVCMVNQYAVDRSENGTRWSKRRMRPDEFAKFYKAFAEAIEFAYISRKQLHACVVAAVASAWFTQDRERLSQFLFVLGSGVATDSSDNAAIRLRDFLIKKQYGQGESARNDLFLKACSAVQAFLEGRPLSKLYAASDNTFPLPNIH